tara:strand:- start:7945 stop:8079 length:135 start_codon:yes stop_codon:yes gene_type:complete
MPDMAFFVEHIEIDQGLFLSLLSLKDERFLTPNRLVCLIDTEHP